MSTNENKLVSSKEAEEEENTSKTTNNQNSNDHGLIRVPDLVWHFLEYSKNL